jgi:hypothetical protein
MKKLGLIAGLILGLVMVSYSPVHANWGWYRCNIEKAGPYSSTFNVYLTETGSSIFTNKQFTFYSTIDAESQKRMIATFLTAISSGKQVDVMLYSTYNASIYGVYIVVQGVEP